MEKIMLWLIIAAIIFYGLLYLKGKRYTATDSEFKQAGVRVDFQQGTITIKGRTFKASQVTGMNSRALTTTHRSGDSKVKAVTIELDDMNRPNYKIMFFSRGHAEKFMQRLSTALRRAGGPSFV